MPGSGLSFALGNDDNPWNVSYAAEFLVTPCLLCNSWQISCSCLMVQDFVEVAPRREFTTWEIQLPLFKPASCSSGGCEKCGESWRSGISSPAPEGLSFKIKQIPALGGVGILKQSRSRPSRGSGGSTWHHRAPRICSLFPSLEQQPSELFWGGKARFAAWPEPAGVSALSRGPGLRDSASPSRAESKQS